MDDSHLIIKIKNCVGELSEHHCGFILLKESFLANVFKKISL
jgi:hypothetical protein